VLESVERGQKLNSLLATSLQQSQASQVITSFYLFLQKKNREKVQNRKVA